MVGKVMPVSEKRTALQEAEWEDDVGEEGAFDREMMLQSRCLCPFSLYSRLTIPSQRWRNYEFIALELYSTDLLGWGKPSSLLLSSITWRDTTSRHSTSEVCWATQLGYAMHRSAILSSADLL